MLFKPTPKLLKAMAANKRGRKQCMSLIEEFKPDCVISTGGYVSAPLLMAAQKSNVPIMIHEANAFPGRANKLFARDCALVMTGFPDQESRLSTQAIRSGATCSEETRKDLEKNSA